MLNRLEQPVRPAMKGPASVLALLAAGILATGCDADTSRQLRTTFDASNSDMTVAEAARLEGVPLFWLGPEFEGLSLISISGNGSYGATFIYGDCRIPRGQSDGGCAPPLQIQTIRMCRPQTTNAPLAQRRTLRGVPAGSRGGGTVLLSRHVEVRVFATSDEGARGIGAIRVMRAINVKAPGAVGARKPLPPPPAAAEKRTPCSSSAP